LDDRVLELQEAVDQKLFKGLQNVLTSKDHTNFADSILSIHNFINYTSFIYFLDICYNHSVDFALQLSLYASCISLKAIFTYYNSSIRCNDNTPLGNEIVNGIIYY